MLYLPLVVFLLLIHAIEKLLAERDLVPSPIFIVGSMYSKDIDFLSFPTCRIEGQSLSQEHHENKGEDISK